MGKLENGEKTKAKMVVIKAGVSHALNIYDIKEFCKWRQTFKFIEINIEIIWMIAFDAQKMESEYKIDKILF